MPGQSVDVNTLVGLLSRIETPWIANITDGGDLEIRFGEGHVVSFGNMEGSCSVCHASHELTALAPALAQEVLDLRSLYFDQHDALFSKIPMMTPVEWAGLSAESRALVNKEALIVRGRIQALEAEIARLKSVKVNDSIDQESVTAGWTLEKIISLQINVEAAKEAAEREKHFGQMRLDAAEAEIRNLNEMYGVKSEKMKQFGKLLITDGPSNGVDMLDKV